MFSTVFVAGLVCAAVPAEVVVPLACDEKLQAARPWGDELVFGSWLASGERTLLRLKDGVAWVARGGAMVGERSFGPLPFEPAVFAYDPDTPRLAIAAVPAGFRDGLGSRVAVWEGGTWHTRPQPEAVVTALFWHGATLHAAVRTCTNRRCSNKTGLSQLLALPRTLVVWKALDPGARRWRDVLSLPVPEAWFEHFERRYGHGKWDFGVGVWQDAIRELTGGFFVPTPSGRFWFAGKGVGPVLRCDASGRKELEVALVGLVPQHRFTSRGVDGGSERLPAAAILAAASLGEDLLLLAWLEQGLGVVQIAPGGAVSVRLLPEGSTVRQLWVEDGRVRVHPPCGVLPLAPSSAP